MTFAVVRVRGIINIKKEIRDTMAMLRLNKANHCVLVPDTPTHIGMLNKIKDYVTWGEVSPEVLEKMLRKRGKLEGGSDFTELYLKENSDIPSISDFSKALIEGKMALNDVPKLKPVVRLHPPIKGYEGIKKPYKLGGALGYRGSDINDLIIRMLEQGNKE